MNKALFVAIVLMLGCVAPGLAVAEDQPSESASQPSPEPQAQLPLPPPPGGMPRTDASPPFEPVEERASALPAFSASSRGDSFAPLLEIEPASESIPSPGAADVEGGVVVGKDRISLDLKGIDISELLRILSIKMGITIVPTRSVTGRVNIFLNNLTLEDALDVLLISQDLAAERSGSIIRIMTAAEYEKNFGRKYNEKRHYASTVLSYAKPSTVFTVLNQIKSDIGKVIVDEATGSILLIDTPDRIEQMQASIQQLDQQPETEVFELQYAKPADIKTHLQGMITPGSGEVVVDERSSKVVVSDLPQKMQKIRRIIKELDAENREVFIEAEIVQITLTDEFSRGVDWRKIFDQDYLRGLTVDGVFNLSPVPSQYVELNMGNLTRDRFEVMMRALQTYGKTKVLSSPRITVLNNQEAKILVGVRDAYVTQTLSQADTSTVTSENIQFIDVGVKLNVTPVINKEGFVTLRIKPEVSSVQDTLTTALGSRVPIVETSEAETMVKVKDGNMLMIAGLIKNEETDDEVGLPFLHRAPLIGPLFGTRTREKTKTEIVVFLTPHIITGETTHPSMMPDKVVPSELLSGSLQERVIRRELEESTRVPETETNRFEHSIQGLVETDKRSRVQAFDIQQKMKGARDL